MLWYHSNLHDLNIIGRNSYPFPGPLHFKQVRVNNKHGIAKNLNALIIWPCNAVKCVFHEANQLASAYSRASKERKRKGNSTVKGVHTCSIRMAQNGGRHQAWCLLTTP